ncbi:DNA polymerase IV [soil metagenome]
MNNSSLIAHFDLDSFFVSVERILNPALLGKPVIVGGEQRGVVAACSYEARKFGVHSAMPSAKAKQLCPHAIFVKSTRGAYSRFSKLVTEIIASKAPLFEKASIDEFYLDLSGMDKFFDPLQWTIDLRKEITDKTSLPISFGLARNKMVAKMATNAAKPNGYLFVPAGAEKEFLAPLDVGKIPGVGEHLKMVLKEAGILKIGDIQKMSAQESEQKLGNRGRELWVRCQGQYNSVLEPYHEAKSVSTENTFDENVTDQDFLMKEIVRMTEKISYELRQDGKVAGCIAVKLRYPDFETTTKQATINYTSADEELIPFAKELFHKLYRKGKPVRLLGVRLTDLTNSVVQPDLFNDSERKQDLYKAIDDVKNKFGRTSIHRASSK